MKELFDRIIKKDSKEYYKQISKYLDNSKKKFIVTANPETFMLAKTNIEMREIILDEENDVIPDGIAIVKGAKKLGLNITERITGIDTSVEILKLLNNKKKSLFLFGASEEVSKKIVEVIKIEYPSIKILGAVDGYVENKDEVFKNIIEMEPDVCLVALGIPNQEFLINKYIKYAKKGIFMGVGGTFDVLSGVKKRAPKLFIKLNLEWFYRIVCEPSRLKRFYKNNIKFLKEIKKEKKN